MGTGMIRIYAYENDKEYKDFPNDVFRRKYAVFSYMEDKVCIYEKPYRLSTAYIVGENTHAVINNYEGSTTNENISNEYVTNQYTTKEGDKTILNFNMKLWIIGISILIVILLWMI